MEEAKPKGCEQTVQQPEPNVSSIASFHMSNSKEQKIDIESVRSKENADQSFSFKSDTTTGSIPCSSSIALTNSTNADLSKAPDALNPTLPAASVDILNYIEDGSCKTESLRTGVEAHNSDGDVIRYVESTCGSPTNISCSVPGTNEVQQLGPVAGNVSCLSVDTGGKSGKLEMADQNHTSDAQRNDRDFTFDVGKVTKSSVNNTNEKGWKPFPYVEPVESFQTNLRESGEGTSRPSNSQTMNEVGKKRDSGKRRSKTGSGTASVKTNREKPTKKSTTKSSSSVAYNKRNTTSALSGPNKNLSSPDQGKDLQTTKDVEDLQQLQLRAQIFAYGSLIQGSTPDETCMIAAFGETETGMKVTEQASRESFIQGKSAAFPAGRSANNSSPISHPSVAGSIPSPWSLRTSSHDVMQAGSSLRAPLSDSHPSFTSLHLYSSPQTRAITENANYWPSQISNHVPWMLVPHTSVPHASSPYAIFSSSEIVQVTPIRDLAVTIPVSLTSSVHPVSSSLASLEGSPAAVSVPSELKKISSTSGREYAGEKKPRKRRKKAPSVDDQLLPVQSQTDSRSPTVENKDNPAAASPIIHTTATSPAEPPSSSFTDISCTQLASGPLSHVVPKIDFTSGWQRSEDPKPRKRRKSVSSVDRGTPHADSQPIPVNSSPNGPRVPTDSIISLSKFSCSNPISISSAEPSTSSFNASAGVQLVSNLLHAAVSSPAAHVTGPTEVNKSASTPVQQISLGPKQRRGKNTPSMDNQPIHAPSMSNQPISGQKVQTGSIMSTIVSEYTLATTCPNLHGTPSNLTPSVSEAAIGMSISSSFTLTPPSKYQIISSGDTKQEVILSKENGNQIELGKRQAEDAAAFAAYAARLREEVWSQLAHQKNREHSTDVEGGMISAAVAVAAAASVAKAAAAAAKVAFEAAMQAQLMAEEALTLKNMDVSGLNTGIRTTGGKKRSGKVAPASTPNRKGKPGTPSSLIEPSNHSPEDDVAAGLAATKRTQNLDAVVKLAELTAEAISQATTVVAMGDPVPLSLNNLLEAGPDSYWTWQHGVRQYLLLPNNAEGGQQSNKGYGECNGSNPNKSSQKDTEQGGKAIKTSGESCGQSPVNYREPVNSGHQDVSVVETSRTRHKKKKTIDFTKGIRSTPSSMVEARSEPILIIPEGPEKNVQSESSEENFMPGSLVEVNSDMGGLGAVWLPAKVLEVKGGNALVQYNISFPSEGGGQKKQWIPIEIVDEKPPRIRIAQPVKFEGKRKRRRATIGNHNCAVGDHVDAWIRHRWREGVILEKHKDDETKLTVHFPAGGETSTVKIWNIRPSLFWKEGQWVEWSRDTTSWINEDDVPCEKRQKMEEKLEQKNLMEVRVVDAFMEHPKLDPFVLPTKDKPFTIGWSTTKNNSAGRGLKRNELQKEAKKVVFGVPKPGRKTKFVDVRKHYIDEQIGKVGGTNDSQFDVHVRPHGSSALQITSKDDPDRDRANNTKCEDVKSGEHQVTRSKTRGKQNSLDLGPSVGNEVDPQKLNKEIGSFPDDPEGQNAPRGARGEDVSSSGKKSSSVVDSNLASNVKFATSNEKLYSDENVSAPTGNPRKLTSKPRRSNRRIQPTSRLLAGIESSLTVDNVSSSGVLHEKQQNVQTRMLSFAKGRAPPRSQMDNLKWMMAKLSRSRK